MHVTGGTEEYHTILNQESLCCCHNSHRIEEDFRACLKRHSSISTLLLYLFIVYLTTI